MTKGKMENTGRALRDTQYDTGTRIKKEEQDILESYERDEWETVENLKSEAQRYQEYARAVFRKDARVNIRISSKDLEALQKRAMEEGIPYQTLIASVLHKYISGRLVESPRD